MCVTATAKRRRRQARMGFKHLARLGDHRRPIIQKHSENYYVNKRLSAIQKIKDISYRMGLKKSRK